MKDRPEGLDEAQVRAGLAAWEIAPQSLSYAPVGFGDYHWTVVDGQQRRWFVTVADLTTKTYCGPSPDAAFGGLGRAMDTAWALRNDHGLPFVVAPERTTAGATVHRLTDQYAISVFPYVEGISGQFGHPAPDGVVDLLAALHRATPPASTPVQRPELASRAQLEAAIAEQHQPWTGGPFAEPARALLARHTAGLRRRLEEFDQRIAGLDGDRLVVTHGEPHPGNLVRQGNRQLVVDWDTVGLAVPERDLWLAAPNPEDLARYADLSGRTPDPAALELYRLRWALDDVAAFLDWFRAPHTASPDTEQAWAGLTETLVSITGEIRK